MARKKGSRQITAATYKAVYEMSVLGVRKCEIAKSEKLNPLSISRIIKRENINGTRKIERRERMA